MTRGKNGPDIEFGDPSSRTTDQSGDKGMRKYLRRIRTPSCRGWGRLVGRCSRLGRTWCWFSLDVVLASDWDLENVVGRAGAKCEIAATKNSWVRHPDFSPLMSDEARPGRLIQKDRLIRLKIRERERGRERERERV